MWLVMTAVGSLMLFGDGERDRSKERAKVFKKVTTHDFSDGVSVTGKRVGPDGIDIVEYPRPVFNPLVKVRLDFNTEMQYSVDEVK